MYVSEIIVGRSLGISTPKRRGIGKDSCLTVYCVVAYLRKLPSQVLGLNIRINYTAQVPGLKNCKAESGLSLALFMARISANYVHHPAAPYDFAVFTDSSDAGAYFHNL